MPTGMLKWLPLPARERFCVSDKGQTVAYRVAVDSYGSTSIRRKSRARFFRPTLRFNGLPAVYAWLDFSNWSRILPSSRTTLTRQTSVSFELKVPPFSHSLLTLLILLQTSIALQSSFRFILLGVLSTHASLIEHLHKT